MSFVYFGNKPLQSLSDSPEEKTLRVFNYGHQMATFYIIITLTSAGCYTAAFPSSRYWKRT